LYKSKLTLVICLAAFLVFGFLGAAFSDSNDEALKLYQSVQAAYKNFVDSSIQKGSDSAEARQWLQKYQELAAEYIKLTGADANQQVFQAPAVPARGGESQPTSYEAPKKPGIIKQISIKFMEKLRELLNKLPSEINNFALGEMNFVSGNYKDALSLYEMAERQAALEGKYYYQAVYWQGRCYLEMAKKAGTSGEQIALYEKAQQKFLNVSMNLTVQTFKNTQQRAYCDDSTNIVVQLKNLIEALKKQTNTNTTNSDVTINSNLNDNSWATTLRYDYMISDQAYINANAMSRNEIQSFLAQKGSCLANAQNGKYPADMIYDAAQKYGISPKVIMSRLQTEQSLITVKNPTQKQLDWATGCGAYDSGNWNSKYKGLENQINYGAQTMRNQYNRGMAKLAQNGSVPMEIDGETINVKNAATYANYMYTPHKHGGKLFRNIYLEFFGGK